MEKKSTELSALARHFELYNKTEGKSQHTIDWYNLALRLLHRFLAEAGKPTILGEVGEADVREVILYLQDRSRWQEHPYIPNRQGKLKAITIQTYIRALRAFFNWLYKEGYTTDNRLAKLKPPNPDKPEIPSTKFQVPKDAEIPFSLLRKTSLLRDYASSETAP